jgi:hypothetical protein
MRIDDRRPRDLSTDDISADPWVSNAAARASSAARDARAASRANAAREDFPEASSSHDPPELLAFYAGLRAETASVVDGVSPPRDAVVQQRLDALRDAYSGPYAVGGAKIAARPMFRMNHGANTPSMEAHQKEVDALAAKVGASGYAVRMGYASPRDLVKVTQALIDAGRLPPGPDVERCVRQMQWEYGIGVDCAGYTNRALQAASGLGPGALGIHQPGTEAFRGLDANGRFTKVAPSSVRPGDVMTLDPAPGETWGHNVIVRGRAVLDGAAKRSFEARFGAAARQLLCGPGPFHAIEVDSSWGAGPDGADFGGYRRDTWIYDESTKAWGFVQPGTTPPVFTVSADGPSNDVFHGAYRAKAGT